MGQSGNKNTILVDSTGCPIYIFVLLNFYIFFRGKINQIFPLFEPTFYEAEGPARGGQAIVKMARQAGGGACRATFEK